MPLHAVSAGSSSVRSRGQQTDPPPLICIGETFQWLVARSILPCKGGMHRSSQSCIMRLSARRPSARTCSMAMPRSSAAWRIIWSSPPSTQPARLRSRSTLPTQPPTTGALLGWRLSAPSHSASVYLLHTGADALSGHVQGCDGPLLKPRGPLPSRDNQRYRSRGSTPHA